MATKVFDHFTGTPSTALASHTPDTDVVGGGWRADNVGFNISGTNTAQCNVSTANSIESIDSGVSDGTITATWIIPSLGAFAGGIALRLTDKDNCWLVGVEDDGGTPYIFIASRIAGVNSVVSSTTDAALHNISVTATISLSGNTIACTLSGGATTVVSYTSASFQNTATRHGLYGYTASGYSGIQIDDFTVTDAVLAPPSISPWGQYSSQPTTVAITAPVGTIYYRTDGSNPTNTDTVYTSPIQVQPESTLKAIAYNSPIYSSVVSATFKPALFYPGAVQREVATGTPFVPTDGYIRFRNNQWDWYGSNLTSVSTLSVAGSPIPSAYPVSCYTSPDTLNWTFQADVVPAQSTHFYVSRMSVEYNPTSAKYVMIAKYVKDDFTVNQMWIGTSSTPYGTFAVSAGYPLNPGGSSFVGDCKTFLDDDGSLYWVWTTSSNSAVNISKMTSSDWLTIASTADTGLGAREAPAMFKRRGIYYLITSTISGWSFGVNTYATATDPMGPWTSRGNPFQPNTFQDYTLAFNSQTCHVFKLPYSDTWIWHGNRWNSNNFTSTTNLFIPIAFADDGAMSISWANQIPVPSGTQNRRSGRDRRTRNIRV